MAKLTTKFYIKLPYRMFTDYAKLIIHILDNGHTVCQQHEWTVIDSLGYASDISPEELVDMSVQLGVVVWICP